MSKIPYLCRTTTPWNANGEFDDEIYRQFLQRFIDSDISVFMASSATEGRSLTLDELSRVYRVGAEYCKGKIVVGASGCEENTARDTIVRAEIAVNAGVDIVNIYGPAGWQGFRPTDAEYLAFFDNVFATIKHPCSVCPNETLGYRPPPALLAKVCNKHPQVVSAVLTGIFDEMYFIELREYLNRDDLEIYVRPQGAFELLSVGATGVAGNYATLLPKTSRAYLDLFQDKKYEESVKAYYDVRRYERFSSPWNNGQITRTVKMFFRAFKLPGGEGRVREPNVLPDESEYEKFVAGVLRLDIPEINEMARAAGVAK